MAEQYSDSLFHSGIEYKPWTVDQINVFEDDIRGRLDLPPKTAYANVDPRNVMLALATIRALQRQVRRLQELWAGYAFHKLDCPYAVEMGDCTCGYGEADMEVGEPE